MSLDSGPGQPDGGARDARTGPAGPATRRFDVVVVGGGPAGENAAQYAIQGSDRTCALVEAELVGGECSYWACMPSKALLRPVEVAHIAAHLDGLEPKPRVDAAGLLARRDVWRSGLDDAGQVAWASGAGIEVVRGRGRLVGERLVEVSGPGGTLILEAAEAVVLATGSVPTIPDAFAAVSPWTSREATGLASVPGSVAIVGGGPVACEAATWLAALGARVTMLVRSRLLGGLDAFAGDYVRSGLESVGVDVRLGAAVRAATRDAAGVHLDCADERVDADEVLVVTGRRPNTDGLGLESVGLRASDLAAGSLPLWLSAVGDVTGAPLLTHLGKYDGRMAGARIAERAGGPPAPVPPGGVPVPQVVFTDPAVASVGAGGDDAAGRGLLVVDQPLTAAAGVGLLRDDADGRARLVVDPATRCIVGATFVGPDVGGQLYPATLAIVARVPLDLLRHVIPAYPDPSEIWLRLVEEGIAALEGR